MHRDSRGVARSGQRGLTLVELLVAMLIMGFVLTLVSQAVYQVAQVSRAAQQVTEQLASRWSGGWAAAPVIANLVAPAETPVNKAFEGGPQRLAGYSTQPPFGSESGVRGFTLELRQMGDGSNRSQLIAAEGDAFGSTAGEQVIAIFDARAEFAYVDASNQTTPVWPANTVSARLPPVDLPSAVLVRERGSQRILMWYGFQGETSRPQAPSNPFGIRG